MLYIFYLISEDFSKKKKFNCNFCCCVKQLNYIKKSSKAFIHKSWPSKMEGYLRSKITKKKFSNVIIDGHLCFTFFTYIGLPFALKSDREMEDLGNKV